MGMQLDNATLDITPEILSLIAELDEFKGTWKALGTLMPERLSALRQVATIESIGSSTRIEGSKLSDQEIATFLSNLEIKHFKTRDEQEVAGYAEVMETLFAHSEWITLTESHVQQLHRDLLIHSTKDERHRGNYKTHTNHVSAFDANGKELGIVFETASPFDTPHLMDELLKWTQQSLENQVLHPLLVIAIFVVTFLAIHPFQDGNGRLSRVLTTLLLLRSGYSYVPYSSLESVVEQTKEAYYLSLRKTQSTIHTEKPKWHPWVIYFLRALQKQKHRLEKKIEREQMVIGTLPKLSIQILELTKEQGRIKIADIVQITGANRNTIKKHLKALVAEAHLKQQGSGKGTWYEPA